MDIAESDWLVLQHSRFGASPDLVVSLRLREVLGRSDLDKLTLLTAEVVTLDRHSWPTSWEDFASSVETGIHFRVAQWSHASEEVGILPVKRLTPRGGK